MKWRSNLLRQAYDPSIINFESGTNSSKKEQIKAFGIWQLAHKINWKGQDTMVLEWKSQREIDTRETSRRRNDPRRRGKEKKGIEPMARGHAVPVRHENRAKHGALINGFVSNSIDMFVDWRSFFFSYCSRHFQCLIWSVPKMEDWRL